MKKIRNCREETKRKNKKKCMKEKSLMNVKEDGGR